jgi:hypothetical protein
MSDIGGKQAVRFEGCWRKTRFGDASDEGGGRIVAQEGLHLGAKHIGAAAFLQKLSTRICLLDQRYQTCLLAGEEWVVTSSWDNFDAFPKRPTTSRCL